MDDTSETTLTVSLPWVKVTDGLPLPKRYTPVLVRWQTGVFGLAFVDFYKNWYTLSTKTPKTPTHYMVISDPEGTHTL